MAKVFQIITLIAALLLPNVGMNAAMAQTCQQFLGHGVGQGNPIQHFNCPTGEQCHCITGVSPGHTQIKLYCDMGNQKLEDHQCKSPDGNVTCGQGEAGCSCNNIAKHGQSLEVKIMISCIVNNKK